MYKKIIVAFSLDHGVGSRALKLAKSLLSEDGEMIAVHVNEPVNELVASLLSESDIERNYQSLNDLLSERLAHVQNVQSKILTGHAGRELTEYAEKVGADCIVVGSHKPGLEDFFLGSTASRVVRHSKCSVHVLR